MRLLFILAISLPGICVAQKRPEPIYYDADWNVCESFKAQYMGFKIKSDSGHKREDYFIATKKPQQIAFYLDDEEKVPHGPMGVYYPDGRMLRKMNFMKGKREGLYLSFHPDGSVRDSIMFINDQPTGVAKSWHSNGYPSDSTAYGANGFAVRVEWFDNGAPSAAGRLMYGKPEGVWQYFHPDGTLAKKTVYSAGEEQSAVYYTKDGKETEAYDRDTEPYFGKGINDWKKYLDKALIWPIGMSFTDYVSATVEVTFTVNHDGKVKDAYVSLPLHPAFDKIALSVVKSAKQWHAGISHNRVVQKQYRQSVSFSQK